MYSVTIETFPQYWRVTQQENNNVLAVTEFPRSTSATVVGLFAADCAEQNENN